MGSVQGALYWRHGMMHTTIYCDAKGCDSKISIQHTAVPSNYGYIKLAVELYLRNHGWELCNLEGDTGHYCSGCHKNRKEEAHGGG